MPAEWMPHQATWISWPHKRESWPGKFEPVEPVMAKFVAAMSSGEKEQGGQAGTASAVVIDAAEEVLVLPIDAALPPDASRETIIAENRYGYLTITSEEKFTVYIDGQRIVNDAFDQYPLRPGPYKIKVVGPRNKAQRFEIIVEASQTVTKNLEW
jgi:hypothetical protein